ncbi:glycoside/pentoside/hexuronide:cation symporter, GPH family [Caldanaerovirga acetigignens]|uniref:Glycoside/pentoside/hexuronide:cation symporter, GPH family n=1 Tax=Caldanaerovirga acetigignens TaxID=447595 RepID=A0A1M7HC03_9FIRM|nr:MFS transporter [Caldanaerovirga acetigignens]SHM26005.1 glycoside/pentoside/hexuronide:cation symporter, GPH family [Caldanaerovirga acetigignens]
MLGGQGAVPNKVINSYALVDFTFNLMMMVAVTYYAYFLTDVAMIEAAFMGTILLIARICDMISVPITGGIIQNSHLKWGKYRSWILIAPPFTATFFILMFTNPPLNQISKAVFLGACYVVAHVCVNFAYNGHISMMSILGRTPQDRLRLSQRKMQFMTASSLVFSLTCMPLINLLGRGNEGRGFFLTVALFALIQVLGYWNLFRQSEGYDVYEKDKAAIKGSTKASAGEMFVNMLSNGPLMALFVSGIIGNTSLFVISSLLTYYYKYVAGNLGMITIHLTSQSVFSFLGSLIAPFIVAKLGKRSTFIFASLLNPVLYTILFLSGGRNPYLFIALSSIGAFLGASSMSIGPALYVDTAEYGKWKTGKDLTAFIMSMSAMPIKIGVALSGAVVGYGLAIIGYNPLAEPTEALIRGIINLVTLIPISCGLTAAIIFILFYKLTDEKVMEIMSANQVR